MHVKVYDVIESISVLAKNLQCFLFAKKLQSNLNQTFICCFVNLEQHGKANRVHFCVLVIYANYDSSGTIAMY